MKNIRIVGFICVALLVSTAALTACSDDDDPTNQNIFVPTGDTDTEDPDADVGPDPDPDADHDDDTDVDEPGDPCDGVSCSGGEVCVEGQCTSATSAGYSCAEPYELGMLSAGEHVTHQADPRQEPNVLNTQCSVNDESPQAVFSFSVSEVLNITLDAELINPDLAHRMARDVRVDFCGSQVSSVDCSADTAPQHFLAEPGHDYYIIVEARTGSQIAQLEIDLQTEGVVCHPAGDVSCQSDELVLCHGGDEERFFGCVDGCTDGTCHGDSCANPIEVRESTTVTADLDGYNSNFDFSNDSSNCSSSGDGISTSGEDLVFWLPELAGGETIEVIRPDTSYAIGVMETCGDSPPNCIHGHSSGSDFEWEVPSEGDYFLVINRYSSSSGEEVDFTIEITE